MSVLSRMVSRLSTMSSVAVCDGGSTYQLCHPSSVNVSAATMPQATQGALPSGRMKEAGAPYSRMMSSRNSDAFGSSRFSHSSAACRSASSSSAMRHAWCEGQYVKYMDKIAVNDACY